MKQTILITGASGFIGTFFFNYLKSKNYNVYGVDFNIFKKEDNNIFDIDLINFDEKKKLFNKIKPDFIFHLAAFAGPPRNEKDPDLAYKYNVGLVKVVLKDLDSSVPIFFPSTDKIFTGQKFPNEDTILNPDNVHGKLKLECENLIRNHTKKHFIMRQPVVHSSGGYKRNTKMSGPGSFIDKAIDDINSKKKVNIFSNVKRCFIKVEELIELYEMLIESEYFGTYNLASPMLSYYDRIREICTKNNVDYKNFLIPTEGKINPLEQNIDSSKFEKVFKRKLS